MISGSNTEERLFAVEHIRRMRGGAQAHLVRASDDNFYVVKFHNNPQHIRILANEYLAGRLGALIGLPMPEVKIIDVSESFIAGSPNLRIESAGVSVPCGSGLQFASRYVADIWQHRIFDYLPRSMFDRVINQQDFPRVLAFDKWAGNTDGRQALFVMSLKDRLYRTVFLDQGYCFNAEQWAFPDLALHGVYYCNRVYAQVTGWESFQPVLSRIEQIDIADLWNVALEIPKSWYESNSESLLTLIRTLHQRRLIVRRLITAFRNSSRKPFPNWASD